MVLQEMEGGFTKRDYGAVYLSARGSQGLAVSVIFTTLACGFVGLRLFTRVKILRKMEANDWMVVIALVCSKIVLKPHEC